MEFQAPLTLLLVVVTCLISFVGFQNNSVTDKLILWPSQMRDASEYHRFLSSGFIHQDTMHLIFNMFTLYFMGGFVETAFMAIGQHFMYLVLYLLGIVVATLPSFFKNRDNPYYRSLGASGGVAAVVFSSVYFAPWSKLLIFFITVPSILFAVIYLAYSAYMGKKGNDNINHDAHFWGAIFGFFFTLLVSPDHGRFFLEQMMHPSFF